MGSEQGIAMNCLGMKSPSMNCPSADWLTTVSRIVQAGLILRHQMNHLGGIGMKNRKRLCTIRTSPVLGQQIIDDIFKP